MTPDTIFDYATWKLEFPGYETDRLIPSVYQSADGTARTVFGGVYAVLVLDGNRMGTDPADRICRVGLAGRPISVSGFETGVISQLHSRRIGSTTTDALARAVGAPILPTPAKPGEVVKCSDCNGTGQVTCYTCDHEHDCDDCDGTGKVKGQDTGPVWPEPTLLNVGGVLLDRRNIANLLPGVPSGPCEVVAVGKPDRIQILGEGWRLVAIGATPQPGQPEPIPFDLEGTR